MAEAEELTAHMLADDAETAPRIPADVWQKKATGGATVASALAEVGPVRYLGVKVTPRMAHLTSTLAAKNNMSRDTYLRHLIACVLEAECGEDYEQMMSAILFTRRRGRPAGSRTKRGDGGGDG